jgi:hypothetical protein
VVFGCKTVSEQSLALTDVKAASLFRSFLHPDTIKTPFVYESSP